ncbi:hypothetical protein [Rhodoblastus sphagnicola]|nr:hypothetical protein [Rhodoblastus sphagnicola]
MRRTRARIVARGWFNDPHSRQDPFIGASIEPAPRWLRVGADPERVGIPRAAFDQSPFFEHDAPRGDLAAEARVVRYHDHGLRQVQKDGNDAIVEGLVKRIGEMLDEMVLCGIQSGAGARANPGRSGLSPGFSRLTFGVQTIWKWPCAGRAVRQASAVADMAALNPFTIGLLRELKELQQETYEAQAVSCSFHLSSQGLSPQPGDSANPSGQRTLNSAIHLISGKRFPPALGKATDISSYLALRSASFTCSNIGRT